MPLDASGDVLGSLGQQFSASQQLRELAPARLNSLCSRWQRRWILVKQVRLLGQASFWRLPHLALRRRRRPLRRPRRLAERCASHLVLPEFTADARCETVINETQEADAVHEYARECL